MPCAGKGKVVRRSYGADRALVKWGENKGTAGGTESGAGGEAGGETAAPSVSGSKDGSYTVKDGKVDLVVSDDYGTPENTYTVTINDIASKSTTDALIGADSTEALEKVYENTNYIAGAGSLADADVILDGAIKDVSDRTDQNTQDILNLSGDVRHLGSCMNKAVAGAAALAALHPLDFDPDDKATFAAAVGSYKGESATAIGAFCRPNEDTMFNIGGAFGNGEKMWNAGISFKLGSGNDVPASRAGMAAEIRSLRSENQTMKERLEELEAQMKALLYRNNIENA